MVHVKNWESTSLNMMGHVSNMFGNLKHVKKKTKKLSDIFGKVLEIKMT
jgi:hypothetical protein